MKQRAVKFSLSFILLITALFLSAPSPAYQEASPAENNAARLLLKNGLTLILKEDHRTPTFALSLFVRVGSATEAEYTGCGITHFIEHMIFKGTATRSGQQLESEIKSFGADLGAYTTYDYTAFKMEGPSSNILPLLDIFCDMVANPKFDGDEFEKEKNVIKKEMQLIQDDPAKYLSMQFWQTAFLVHPYRNPVIGYEGAFEELRPDDLRAYYKRSYLPNNMALVVVGDIDSESVKKKMEESFGTLRRKGFPEPVLADEPNQLTPRYQELPYAVSKTYMMMGFHSVDLASKDLYALDTLAILAGGGNSSILHQDLHNRLNLVHAINAYNYTPFNSGVFVFSAIFEPANKDKVIKEVLNIIERIKKSPFKKKELDKAKNQVISSYLFSKQTQASQADDLGISQLLTGDMDFSKRYVEGVNAVTPHQIMDAAKRYLTRENMTAVLLVPSAIKEAESKAKTKARAAVRGVARKNLRNGIRVLLSEDKTLPVASVRICIKGGLRVEDKDNNGISNLTALMLTKGTTSRSEEQIFSFVESLGGSLSAYSANNSLGLSLDIMSKDLKKGIELLGDILTHPAFAGDRLKVLKEDVLANIKEVDDDIFALTQKKLKQGLFPDHPYGMLSIGNPDTVNRINRKEILDFYKRHCVGPNIVISVCGDIDPEQVHRWIDSSFKGIRKKSPPQLEEIELVALKGAVEIREEMDKEQAAVMIGFRSAGVADPDKYPLQILSSVFSGGAGRLFANIRQKKGLAYTLGTFGMTGIDTGTFIFYAASSSENIDAVKDEIIVLIKEVCEAGITQEEIDSAKKTLIAKHQIELQTAGSFALQTALDELYDLSYAHYLHYAEKINSPSREQIIQTANKYFTLESCVITITTPKDRG